MRHETIYTINKKYKHNIRILLRQKWQNNGCTSNAEHRYWEWPLFGKNGANESGGGWKRLVQKKKENKYLLIKKEL